MASFQTQNQSLLSTDQSTEKTLNTNRDLTNETAIPKKFIPDAYSKDFTRKQARAINPTNARFIVLKKNKTIPVLQMQNWTRNSLKSTTTGDLT